MSELALVTLAITQPSPTIILELTQNAAEIFKHKPLEERRVLLGDISSNITLNGKRMEVIWRPETEVIRKAVENTKRLEKILEPSAHIRNSGDILPYRSTWLTTIEEVITAIKQDTAEFYNQYSV